MREGDHLNVNLMPPVVTVVEPIAEGLVDLEDNVVPISKRLIAADLDRPAGLLAGELLRHRPADSRHLKRVQPGLCCPAGSLRIEDRRCLAFVISFSARCTFPSATHPQKPSPGSDSM